MSFSGAIKSLFTNCFKVSGRASRSEYWFSYLFIVLVSVALYGLCAIALIGGVVGAAGGSAGAAGGGFAIAAIGYVILIVWFIFVAIAQTIMLVRRLHDTNKSGWWWLLNFVPFGGIVLFVFTVMPSSPGVNNYGS